LPASSAGIKGHWDEELHGMDYLVYAYLQRDKLPWPKDNWIPFSFRSISINFKVAYAFASIPVLY
jgi:hypothetical protein